MKRDQMNNPSHKIAGILHGLRNPVLKIMHVKKLDKKSFSKKTGLSYQAAKNWNIGIVESPRPSTVKKIAKFLNVDAVELMRDVQCWINEDWKHDPKEYVYQNIDDLD